MRDDYQLYAQDYVEEETCYVCKDSKPITELRVVDTDERGGQAQVCEDCIAKGWAEE